MPEEAEREAGREIVRYDGRVVYIHWAVIVTFFVLLATSLVLLRDWFWETFKIRGTEPIIRTPDWAADAHLVLAAIVLLLGLLHVLLHVRQERKYILPTNVQADFDRSVHALRYVLFLSSWEEKGSAHKYRGHQRMAYVITFYTIALSAITGAIALWGEWEEMGMLLHVVAGIMVLLNSYITAYTEYWGHVLGITLILIVLFIPQGVAGLVHEKYLAWQRRREA